MCDIYTANCPVCNAETGMHLADFNTSKSEVEVYCHKHIPHDTKDGCVWLNDDKKKVFVRALTDNAKANAEGNHPNDMDPVLLTMFGVNQEIT